MSAREYHPQPTAEQHTVEHIVTKIKSMFGVHDVHVERDTGKITVHVTDEEIYPGIDQALSEHNYIPGMGVM